jgi:transposase
MDTTTLYFEGRGGETPGQNGKTKDYRPHLKQMIVGIITDQDGRPVCSEMWPGNTADVTTLIPVIDPLAAALRDRPGLRRCRPWHDQRRDYRRPRGARDRIHLRLS